MGPLYRYHHLGIPTADDVAGGTYLPHLKMTVSDDTATPYGIQWMRFDEDCPLPHLVKRVPHVAFEVDDLKAAIRGKKVIIQPNQPSPGGRSGSVLIIAFNAVFETRKTRP